MFATLLLSCAGCRERPAPEVAKALQQLLFSSSTLPYQATQLFTKERKRLLCNSSREVLTWVPPPLLMRWWWRLLVVMWWWCDAAMGRWWMMMEADGRFFLVLRGSLFDLIGWNWRTYWWQLIFSEENSCGSIESNRGDPLLLSRSSIFEQQIGSFVC